MEVAEKSAWNAFVEVLRYIFNSFIRAFLGDFKELQGERFHHYIRNIEYISDISFTVIQIYRLITAVVLLVTGLFKENLIKESFKQIKFVL